MKQKQKQKLTVFFWRGLGTGRYGFTVVESYKVSECPDTLRKSQAYHQICSCHPGRVQLDGLSQDGVEVDLVFHIATVVVEGKLSTL
jgi:hypothetical protein